MTTLKLQERTEERALGVIGNGANAQSLEERTDTLYCSTHGAAKGYHGYCELCYDEGYRDWVAVQSVKSLIPSWTGINVDGRQVIVAKVKDALDAVQTISRYKGSDALVLLIWGNLVTALDRGRIGPHWTLNGAAEDDADEEIECVRCCQPFRPTWGDERLCDSCYLAENGPPHR